MNRMVTSAPDTAGPFPLTIYTLVDPDEPDEWFLFDNSASATALDISFSAGWSGGADVDVVVFNADTGAFENCGIGNTGCGLSNPEAGSIIVPAGETWALLINLYSGDRTVVQVDFTSP